MATRRDQLQSYQFMTQRVISAFVMRETDPAQTPLRRGVGAIFGGIMIAVVVSAVFGIYGILTKVGSNAWRSDGSVVVEKETGASFVFFSGELHPTLNYASAMLAAGRPNPAVYRVSSRSLSTVPRGLTIGIVGAPDSLPTGGSRVGYPWSLCAVPGTDASGRPNSTVLLAVGTASSGRRLGAPEGMLARDTVAGTTYLVWNGRRHQLNDPGTTVPALFGAVAAPVPFGTAWLNALPTGLSIGPITIDERGSPSAAVPGRDVGDLLVAETGSGPQYYVVFDDGLAAITHLQEAILRAQSAAQPERISVNDATSAPRSNRLRQPTGETAPPRSPPTLVAPAGNDLLCAITRDAAAVPEIAVGGEIDGLTSANPTGSAGGGRVLADRVYVPAGRVAVVRVMGAPDAGTGPYTVVTDIGIQYPVPSPDVLAMLGYSPTQAVDVPFGLVTKVPTGPTLDPAAALRPAPIAGTN